MSHLCNKTAICKVKNKKQKINKDKTIYHETN